MTTNNRGWNKGDNECYKEKTLMDNFILGIASGLIVGLFVGWWIGHHNSQLAEGRDAKNRRILAEDGFFKILSEERAKLENAGLDEGIFFVQSIPILTQAVHKMRPVYKTYRWRCLHRVLEQYKSQDKSEFGKGRERFTAHYRENKSHIDRLNGWLDKFEDVAKNAPEP